MARQLTVDDLILYETIFYDKWPSTVRDAEAFLPVCVDGTLGELTTTMQENAIYLCISNVKTDLDYAKRAWEGNAATRVFIKDGTFASVSKEYVIAGYRGILCSHPKYLSGYNMESRTYMEPDTFGSMFTNYLGIFCENGIAMNPPKDEKKEKMKLNRLYVFSNGGYTYWRDDIKTVKIAKLIFFEKNPAATNRFDQTIMWKRDYTGGNVGDLFKSYHPPALPIFVKSKRINGLWIKQGQQIVKPSGVYVKQGGAIKKK